MHDTERRNADDKVVALEGKERRRILGEVMDLHNEDVALLVGSGTDKKGNSRLRKWLIGVLVCLCASLVIVNSLTYDHISIYSRSGRPSSSHLQNNEIEVGSTTDFPLPPTPGYVVRTTGCRIPAFDVLDSSIKQYFKDDSPLKCEAGSHLPLVDSNLTSLFVDANAKQHFYPEVEEEAECCWRKFWRANKSDNSVTYDKTCENFTTSVNVEGAEFVKVECRRGGKEIYKDYHAFLPRKSKVEKRCNSSAIPGQKSGRLSVLILGLDAVSRLNFHRTMPTTVEKLRNLQAVEMLGYNKVADNTFPNMIPVLSGMSEEELTRRCWTTKRMPFDGCPFLWQNFSAAGYRTVLGEDACSMSIFNYLKTGFRDQPTDYYLRPYCLAAENDIGNTHKLNADLCVGTRKTFENLLNYGKKLVKEFSRESYFALFWQASLTHDFVTYPRFGDESYRNFITEAYENGLLNTTALLLMSDHGIRWGSFRQTYQGHVEESLPFVFLILPIWWREKFPSAWANLRRNSRSLTTPFDLHETLLHILNPEELGEERLKERSRRVSESQKAPRGISWFIPIPDHRTCTLAGIPGHWCMCHLSENASTNGTVVRLAVKFLIEKLNHMVRDYPQCAELKLKSVMDAKVWTDKSRLVKERTAPTVDYTITVQTDPGDAIFEASVRYRTEDQSQRLVGSVSRLNLYGKQSACVDDFKMRLYCYCR